jgi:hypothetical protein
VGRGGDKSEGSSPKWGVENGNRIMYPINCNLSTVPHTMIGKSCSLSAICIRVHPVRQRDGTTGVIKRREIELGDQFGDCMISVFGEHVHLFDHDPIGRPVTLSGFDLLMYANTISICLRKDSTILVGSDADVATASLQRLQL